MFYQETVYALRISDWSSDVCSSDLLGLVGLLLLVEPELAEVHDLADRRIGVGLCFDQVEPGLFGQLQGLFARTHADHCTVRIDHAHVRDADVLVAAVLLVVRDTDMWISKETRAVRLGGRACRRTTIEAMHRVPPLRCCVPVSQARGKVCDGHRPQIFP